MKHNNITNDPIVSEKKTSAGLEDSGKETKMVVLQSIGYPFLCNLVENPKIEIFDNELFELYAREQWVGYKVKEGSFLFDQKLLPDFAFKVIKAHPDDSRITKNTSILLMEVEEVREIKKIESNLKITDVIGQERAKTKCKIITRYLQEPESFQEWAPNNVLFHGVTEQEKQCWQNLCLMSQVPLSWLRYKSHRGTRGGWSTPNTRTFEAAVAYSPSVIFIDEIDAIGLDRRYQSSGDVSKW